MMSARSGVSRFSMLLGAVAAAAVIAACGSSSSSSSGGAGVSAGSSSAASGSGSGANLAAVKASVLAHTSAPKIGPQVPIGKPIPKGKTIGYVNCGQPACTLVGDSFAAAAKVLGWKVDMVNPPEPTPEAIQAAFNKVIGDHPDGVWSSSLSPSLYPHQLAELNAMHIPVMSSGGTDVSGHGGITYETTPAVAQGIATRWMADKIILDLGGHGSVGFVFLTGYAIVNEYWQNFESEMKARCPGCTVARVDVQPTDLGKDAATLIANFLRAHPGMKALYLTYGLEYEGLPAAAKGAGVKMPLVYVWTPDTSTLPLLSSGVWKAAATTGGPTVGWQIADAFARVFTGQSVAADKSFPQLGVIWSKDYNNVPPPTTNAGAPPKYQAQFEALWGLH